MHILLFLLFIVIFFFLFLGSILRGVIRFFLPKHREASAAYGNAQNSSQSQTGTTSEKVFSKDEGEYVSFEELEEK